jgi:hypothetical protein
LILVVCLLPQWRRWRWLAYVKAPSQQALLEARLQPLLDELPPGAIVGFVTNGDERRLQMAASYVAAPRLLSPGTAPALIVGLFEQPPGPFFFDHPLTIVKDYGHGVMLLEKRR